MRFKAKYLFFTLTAAMILTSCAKSSEDSGLNDNEIRVFNAWVDAQKYAYPQFEWRQTSLGSYVLLSTQTQGQTAGTQDEAPYVLLDYTVTPLSNRMVESDVPGQYLYSRVTSTTQEAIDRQIGQYEQSTYYGPQIFQRSDNSMSAGIDEIVSEMRVGERRWAVIPGWLFSTTRYADAAEYQANVSGVNAAYDITLREIIQDIKAYQLDSMKSYISRHYPQKALDDTAATGWGCYYIQTVPPTDTTSFPTDTTFYINYTGRLLNGKVFDTTIADTAKVYGLYDSSNTYSTVLVNWSESGSTITLTSSSTSVITGFSTGIKQMRHNEKGVCIFWSGLGYGSSGSDNSIPPFSPLEFEIEIVEE